jgi:hypothetical protein
MNRGLLVALPVIAIALAQPVAASSPDTLGPPSILARVVDAFTGLPIGGADVVVTFIEGDPNDPVVIGPVYTTTTNPGGHFMISRLPAGAYILSVSRDGYVSFGEGAHDGVPPTGELIEISALYRGPSGGNILLTPCRECFR